MKKKLTVNTVAFGNLKQRRKQYTILIIGIILAMVFSSGTMFFLSCTKSSNEEYKRRTFGNFYGYYFAPEDFVDVKQGKKDGLIEEYGYAHILGYAYTDEENKDKGTSVAWLDETAKELYYLSFSEGRYPEKKGEIALERDSAIRLGINPVVGETINLSMLTANSTDFLSTSVEKTYTIVGILTDKRKNMEKFTEIPQFATAFVSREEEVDIGGKEILAVFFNPTETINEKKVIYISEDIKSYTTVFEEEFLQKIFDNMKGAYSEKMLLNISSLSYDFNGDVMNSSILSVTLAVVLMVCSSIGIVNSFSANLKERKKQIGLLRAVGATKRQIIKIFGRETLIISLICTPVSVLIAYFGVKLYAKIMGDDFIFLPDFTVIIISAAVSVICVMLASLIPLVSATRVTPMQAIKDIELNRKVKQRKIKTQKNFAVPKLIAERNLKLHKIRQISITFILVITIFISSFGISLLKEEMLTSSWSNYNASDYTVCRQSFPSAINYVNCYISDKRISYNNINEILEYPMFDSVSGYKEVVTYIQTDEFSEYMNLREFNESFRYAQSMAGRQLLESCKSADEFFGVWYEGETELYQQFKRNLKTSKELSKTVIRGYDSDLFENNKDRLEVIDGRIDFDKLDSGEEIILVAYENIGIHIKYEDDRVLSFGTNDVDFYNKKSKETPLYTAALDLKAGDTVNLRTVYSNALEDDFEVESFINESALTVCDKEVKIGAIVKPFYLFDGFAIRENLAFMTTATGIDKISGRQQDYEYLFVDYDGEITDEADESAMKHLNFIFSGSNFREFSGYATDKETMNIIKILMMSLFSVMILMFVVCASIVNNALTAEIRDSKNKIGTLRAVGAGVSDIVQIYIRQLVSMYIWGIAIGLGGYSLTYLLLKYFYEGFTASFVIFPAILISLLFCAVCSINLYIKIKKEMKHSIVENIREL